MYLKNAGVGLTSGSVPGVHLIVQILFLYLLALLSPLWTLFSGRLSLCGRKYDLLP